jgi:plasmid maintenance system antidote protein VapI
MRKQLPLDSAAKRKQHPGMTLTEWMATKGHSQAAAGALFGVPSGTVCRWVTGQRTPTLRMALAIEKATSGAVPASSWVEKKGPHARKLARRAS